MPLAFPGDLVLLDDANRADGAADAGAGSTIWQSTKLGGAASTLVVTSNQLAVTTTDAGALTVNDDADFIRVFDIAVSGGSDYFAYFFRLQSPNTGSWQGYWFIIQGGSWRLHKRVSGFSSEVTAIGHSGINSGNSIGVRAYGSTLELYHKEAGLWTNVISTTDTSFLGAGPGYLNLDSTLYRIDDVSSADPALPVATSPVTIYVDPDHPDASNAYNRIEASDPATPMADLQEACMLAQATVDWADTINVKTADSADATNVDPRMYLAIDHRLLRTAAYPAGLPFGNNAGNVPITVTGVLDGDERPIVSKINGRQLRNWIFENLQIGYDTGSGLDHSWLSSIQASSDLTYRNCHWTGGGIQVDGWSGDLDFEDCEVNAPLGPMETIHNGRAFGFSSEPGTAGAAIEAGNVRFTRCLINNVRGDDGIAIGMGEPTDERITGGNLIIEDTIFHNVTEALDEFHTDSVQILGVPNTVIRRCVFIGCTNCLMASDFHNGTVTFENNLSLGAGGMIQMQGTDHLICRHNTFAQIPSPTLNVTIIFFHRYNLPVPFKVTMVNNIMGGLLDDRVTFVGDYHPDTVIDNNIMIAFPGEDTGYGTNLPGFPEFGTSPRMSVIPTDDVIYGTKIANYELSNTPVNSPGIGQALASDITVDLFGRARADPTDVGCLQSDPGTPVIAVARPPYITSRNPGVNQLGVLPNTDVSIVLFPKPGNTLDLATITTGTYFVRDPGGIQIPVSVVDVTGPVDGLYTLTLNFDGSLYPYVIYTARILDSISDSEGSTLGATSAWAFRIAGPLGPALYDGSELGSQGWVIGVV